jgi:hypothetical protein
VGEKEVEGLYEELDARGVEVWDDGDRPEAGVAYANGALAAATSDALQLFLNEIRRYPCWRPRSRPSSRGGWMAATSVRESG